QKVVEVAPAPGLKPETKEKLYAYSLKMAREVQYQNAGTFEYLVDESENIFFIEVNPRIQVEHTVTEQVTGVDIVRSQLLIGQGYRLDESALNIGTQESLTCSGFAVQCRITTEDPENDFTPDYGRLLAYRSPGGFGIRLDAGSAFTGAVISPFFDSLLVKVTGSGRDLPSAARRLWRALQEFRVRGVKTNIAFLLNVLSHPVFQSGATRVNFIADHPELLRYKKGRDRATRLLQFLGEIAVNGNPDVKGTTPRLRYTVAPVPAFNPGTQPPPGSRDRLKFMGREAFVNDLLKNPKVQYTDTSFRDAHQSLLATRVRTYDLLQIAEAYAQAHPELFSIEMWGGATFDVAMRFLHECPWRRLKLLREAIPNILFQMLFRGSNGVGYSAYPDSVIEAFIVKAAENGIDVFRIFDSMNWLEAMKTSIKTVLDQTDALAEVCICYTGDIGDRSRTKYTLKYYLDLAKQIEDLGAHLIAIKDMAGLLKPAAAEELVGELKAALSIPIHLHTHDTSSIQAASYLKAVDAGVDVIDVALASVSGLTSQPNFNSIATMLNQHPRGQAIDVSSLNQFSQYFEVVREFYAPFETELRAGTAEVYEHEIPGGQYSNLRPQARALGLEDEFETVKKNYIAVNQLLGDLVKVTPSSKVVGDVALFMTSNKLTAEDLITRGDELSFPESLKSFFRGDLGQPFGGFPEALQAKVLKGEEAYTCRPNQRIDAIDMEQGFEDFRSSFGDHRSFEEYLSFILYPKVYQDFVQAEKRYGDLSVLPTPAFLYALEPGQELLIDIDRGKTLIIELRYIEAPDEQGMRRVHFRLNGQARAIDVVDQSITPKTRAHRKVERDSHIGAPLQGKLSDLMVSVGDAVEKGAVLFVIEAMKMETTVTAPRAGIVEDIFLQPGDLVATDDLIVNLIDS
ncbi:MAG: pyruvate carboxylase, partial [Bdellovibrionales bacterium]|nr:pyruvate carboxylase [Bdellovibrionales bacterium]